MDSLGRYQIVHRIAMGGMAEVFLGRVSGEGGFEKVVAIKRILQHLAANKKFIKMFMDEARISATLNHSNITQIFEFGRAEDAYFIAMEYVGGLSLRSVMRHFRKKVGQPPPPSMAAFVAANICAGLEYAHTRRDSYGKPQNIIHRDVSPSNVLVSFSGEVKLIDFGVAKASHRMQETVGGDLKGKYAYMSPEQASGTAMDHRSDVFAAGIILLEMLTGKNPFRSENDLATLGNVQRAEVPLPTATLQGGAMALYEIAVRAMGRRPQDRFQSAGDMQEELEHFGRRNPFGARQLGRWMQETFPAEQERVQELLRRAAEEDLPTLELDELEEPTTEEVQTVDRTPAPVASSVDAPTLERPPAGNKKDPVPLRTRKPTMPRPLPTVRDPEPMQVVEGGTPRPDPSRSITPLTPTGGSNVGKVAVPAEAAAPTTPTRAPVGRPPLSGHKRRASPWTHLVLFLGFALAVGGVVFFVLVRTPTGDDRSDGPPMGSIQITVSPPAGAHIYVDGEFHGAMAGGEPYEIKELLAGKHRIKLKGSNFQEVEKIVEVIEGKIAPLTVSLQRE